MRKAESEGDFALELLFLARLALLADTMRGGCGWRREALRLVVARLGKSHKAGCAETEESTSAVQGNTRRYKVMRSI
jgi:hypothetical protein